MFHLFINEFTPRKKQTIEESNYVVIYDSFKKYLTSKKNSFTKIWKNTKFNIPLRLKGRTLTATFILSVDMLVFLCLQQNI